MILQGREGEGLAVYVESEYLFPIFCGRHYLFSSNFSTEDIAYLNLIDAGLFIYFPREPGQNFYFKVFDDKELPAPPPSPQNQLFVP